MKMLKHAILSNMGRETLKRAVDDLQLDGIDRRSVGGMTAGLSRAHRATPEVLVEYLSEAQVKQVADALGVESRGRRAALIGKLLGSTDQGIREEQIRRKISSARGDDGGTRWSKMNEVAMNEPNVEKLDAPSPEDVPFPLRIPRTEIVWPGKYDVKGNLIQPPSVRLPFQVIEVIKEGRTSREELVQSSLPLFSAKPKSLKGDGWRNKLIWGDNLVVESSLIEEFAGKIDLIYIDPPFAVGADFSFRTTIGESDEEVQKEPSVIEAKAYRDTWGRGYDSYLEMIAQRLRLMRELLSPTGTIYVHVGPTASHYVRCILEEIFGPNRFVNEIVWRRAFAHNDPNRCGQIHDTIFVFQRGDTRTWNPVLQKPSPEYVEEFFDQYDPVRKERYNRLPLDAPRHGDGGNLVYEWKGAWPAPNRTWAYIKEKMQEFDRAGRIHYPKNGGMPRLKRYESEYEGTPIQDLWTDINKIHNRSSELLGYNTQKPEALLERIIRASSNPGDLVADFFCGSGTTLSVAERLGRRWIGCDLGRFAIHTTRKRLLELRVQDSETGERGARPFEILNLGRYERKYWQGIAFGNEPKSDVETALAAYVNFILELYKAQAVQGTHIHGKKGSALVHVGAVDAPVTIAQIEDAVAEAKQRGFRELHVLAWEWEMGLFDPLTKLAKAQYGVEVRLLSIPREVMEKRAVEAGDVQFFDLAYLEVEARAGGSGPKASRSVRIRLKDFVIPSIDLIPDEVRKKIRKWSDYVDYWAVDWDFRNDTFVSQWQSYRTRQERTLELETPVHTYLAAGMYQVLIKVIDIFGNDTSHLVRWEAK